MGVEKPDRPNGQTEPNAYSLKVSLAHVAATDS